MRKNAFLKKLFEEQKRKNIEEEENNIFFNELFYKNVVKLTEHFG